IDHQIRARGRSKWGEGPIATGELGGGAAAGADRYDWLDVTLEHLDGGLERAGAGQDELEDVVVTGRRAAAVEATLLGFEAGLPHEVAALGERDRLLLDRVEAVARERAVAEANLERVLAGLAELGVDDDVVGLSGAALIVEAAARHRVLDVRADLGALDGGLEARVLGADDPKHRVEVGLLREEVDEHVAGDRADPVDVLGPRSAAPALGSGAAAEAAANHDSLA